MLSLGASSILPRVSRLSERSRRDSHMTELNIMTAEDLADYVRQKNLDYVSAARRSP